MNSTRIKLEMSLMHIIEIYQTYLSLQIKNEDFIVHSQVLKKEFHSIIVWEEMIRGVF